MSHCWTPRNKRPLASGWSRDWAVFRAAKDGPRRQKQDAVPLWHLLAKTLSSNHGAGLDEKAENLGLRSGWRRRLTFSKHLRVPTMWYCGRSWPHRLLESRSWSRTRKSIIGCHLPVTMNPEKRDCSRAQDIRKGRPMDIVYEVRTSWKEYFGIHGIRTQYRLRHTCSESSLGSRSWYRVLLHAWQGQAPCFGL